MKEKGGRGRRERREEEHPADEDFQLMVLGEGVEGERGKREEGEEGGGAPSRRRFPINQF